jgi:UDP-N-acetylmuramate dehydrogenase
VNSHDQFRRIIDSCLGENPCEIEIRYDEPMSAHTTFKAGGPADCWVRPAGEGVPAFSAALLRAAGAEGMPFFILGGGANILVADRGIRGLVLDTSGWAGKPVWGPGHRVSFPSGISMDQAAELAANAGLSGLEFMAGMPGTVGGGLWMNARCYEREIADTLVETRVLDFSKNGTGGPLAVPADRAAFGYKRSPFQNRPWLILSGSFALKPGDPEKIRAQMETYRRDREAKGHYRFPSAGSVFKNNRDFGKPAGRIIDELGLRGLTIGGAQVAPFHGNIIINTGGAKAADIRALIDEVGARVKTAAGFILEPEILFAGDW